MSPTIASQVAKDDSIDQLKTSKYITDFTFKYSSCINVCGNACL